jgi:NAD(P)-dependent dehydrogenase (short-subunit alcohol dehydrogenase family)
MPLALITGASRGFGLALARTLAEEGWHLIVDGRNAESLRAAIGPLGSTVTLVPGDVADPAHRIELATAVARAGRLDLLVNNASTLGPSPLPGLDRYPVEALEEVFRTNTLAPLALTQALLPHLATGGAIVNVTSDAAVEAYEGWGGYGASKAALDQISAVLGA